MPSHNHLTMMGNLTRDPEIRYTPNGTPVASFGLASNRRFKQGDELKEEVCFLDVVVFGKTAETAVQYLHKGDCALFEGRLQQRRWEQDDGSKRSKHELVAQNVTFIRTKKGGTHDDAQHDPGPEFAHDPNPYS